MAYETHQVREGYRPSAEQAGKRALANLALQMCVADAVQRGDDIWPGKAYQRFKDAGQMTDRLGALSALVHGHSPLAAPALERFHALFAGDDLVIDKWFLLQASAILSHEAQGITGGAVACSEAALEKGCCPLQGQLCSLAAQRSGGGSMCPSVPPC